LFQKERVSNLIPEDEDPLLCFIQEKNSFLSDDEISAQKDHEGG